jgi:hypothetical protein
MADAIPQLNVTGLISAIEKKFPKITFAIKEDFSASTPDNRVKIRQAISDKTKHEDVHDLKSRPLLPNQFVSISHCKSLGGFALADHPVGLDIEETQRVELKNALRIQNIHDDMNFPHPAALWAAKEAVFKSYVKDQPDVLTQVSIKGWERESEGCYTFSCKSGLGRVFLSPQWTVAVFEAVPPVV